MLDEKYLRPVCSWEQLMRVFSELHSTKTQWIFRGLHDWPGDLQTTFERDIISFWKTNAQAEELKHLNGPENRSRRLEIYREILGGNFENHGILYLEKGLLRKFQRQGYHHMANVPKEDSVLEWLALMRHHEAPSRLLDFSYSFFVAVYFAVVEAETGTHCVVWALDTDWMKGVVENGKIGTTRKERSRYRNAWRILRDDLTVNKQKTFNRVFGRLGNPMVYAINPFRLNARLTVQKGIFLCPTDISKPFEDNLNVLLRTPDSEKHFIGYKIKCTRETRLEILRHLHRMNVSHDTLFPGLDGFAKSLRALLPFPELIAPGDESIVSI